MRKIKVMLASRPKMPSEVIEALVERQPDMQVAGEVLDPMRLLFAIKTTPVDAIIITPLDSKGEPPIMPPFTGRTSAVKDRDTFGKR